MDKEVFVQNVIKFCESRGIKPTIACRDSGAGKDLINKVKNGSIPSVERVQMLAKHLGVTTSDLLGETRPDAGGLELPPQTAALVAAMDRLNAEGQEKLVGYADDLVSSGKYKKAGKIGLDKEA